MCQWCPLPSLSSAGAGQTQTSRTNHGFLMGFSLHANIFPSGQGEGFSETAGRAGMPCWWEWTLSAQRPGPLCFRNVFSNAYKVRGLIHRRRASGGWPGRTSWGTQAQRDPPQRSLSAKPACRPRGGRVTVTGPSGGLWHTEEGLGSRKHHCHVPVPAVYGTGGGFEVPGDWVGRTVWSQAPAALEMSPAHAVPDSGHLR